MNKTRLHYVSCRACKCPALKQLLKAQELADALNVPLSWVREQTMRKLIPHEKLGKYARYDLEEVKAHFHKPALGPGAGQPAAPGQCATVPGSKNLTFFSPRKRAAK